MTSQPHNSCFGLGVMMEIQDETKLVNDTSIEQNPILPDEFSSAFVHTTEWMKSIAYM